MSVFLIQTNGREISEDAAPEYIRGAKGPTFVDEPLRHHRYFNANPYWKQEGYKRRDVWESATEGDTALLYCSSSVDEYPTCISHTLPIENKQIDPEGALLEFETPIEIEPKINLYLQEAVSDPWDVDVEYNRIGEDDDVTKRLPEEMLQDDSQGTVYPDVIIHQRGSEDDNLLVIEAKKSENLGDGDRQKIRAYMQHLDYDYGLFVRFDTGQDFEELGYSCEWSYYEQ